MLACRWAHVQFSQLTVFQDNYNQDAGNCKPDTRYIYSRYNKLPSLLATFVGGKFCAELLHWCPTSAASRRLTAKWHGVAGILSSMWFMACGMGLLHSSYLPVSPSHFIRRKFSSYLPQHLLRMEGLVLVHFVLIVIEMWPVIKNPIRLQPGHLCTLQHFPVPGEATPMPDIWISAFI